MKATIDQLVSFIVANGAELGVTFADIEFVGVEYVLNSIAHQRNAVTLEEHTNVEDALWDYFCDGAFEVDYDRAFVKGPA